MIIGWFEDDSTLNVAGHLVIPRLDVVAPVIFLVDTGASTTIISPPDIREAGIPMGLLGNRFSLHGIGGSADFYREPAFLFFMDSDGMTIYQYRPHIGIAQPNDSNRNFPSLLGRDILDFWYLESDPINDELRFTVRRSM